MKNDCRQSNLRQNDDKKMTVYKVTLDKMTI